MDWFGHFFCPTEQVYNSSKNTRSHPLSTGAAEACTPARDTSVDEIRLLLLVDEFSLLNSFKGIITHYSSFVALHGSQVRSEREES